MHDLDEHKANETGFLESRVLELQLKIQEDKVEHIDLYGILLFVFKDTLDAWLPAVVKATRFCARVRHAW